MKASPHHSIRQIHVCTKMFRSSSVYIVTRHLIFYSTGCPVVHHLYRFSWNRAKRFHPVLVSTLLNTSNLVMTINTSKNHHQYSYMPFPIHWVHIHVHVISCHTTSILFIHTISNTSLPYPSLHYRPFYE